MKINKTTNIRNMKAIELLDWIVRDSINGEFLGTIEVPCKEEQTEEWWIDTFGGVPPHSRGVPPHSISEGKYLYFYESQLPSAEVHDMRNAYVAPDTIVELPTDSGFDYIFLYMIEE
jgi:hypothetical protein